MNHTPEQKRAIETVGKHVCVSAGAGSGKTRVLIDRIVYLLQHHNIELSEIVAITFTRKAAAEMKERLRKECYRLAPDDDSEQMDRWRRILHQIDTARITTIDSFCSGLLRKHALWMQDDPDYAVMSDADAKLEPKRIAEETLARLLNEQDESAERMAKAYGISISVEILAGLLDKPNLHGVLAEYSKGSVEDLSAMWLTSLETHVDEKSQEILDVANELRPNLQGFEHFFVEYRNLLVRIFEGILDRQETAVLMPMLEEAAGANFRKAGHRKELDRFEYDQLNTFANQARDLIKGFLIPHYTHDLGDASAALTYDVAVVYGKIFAAYQAHKRTNSIKDFSDLLRDALELLKSEGLREKIAGSIRFLMVDEFQDTNPAQWELAQRLMATDNQSGPELFIVGDVKQSIYRFRNADVTVFQDAQKKTSAPILLNTNFRTLPNVMESVNHFFSESGLLRRVVEPWESLETHRPRAEGNRFEFLLNVLPGETHGKKTSVYQQREAEAARIADHVAAIYTDDSEYRIQEENAEIRTTELRRVEYEDVALLFRKKGSMYLYENALQKLGIPYVTLGGSQFFYRQEIADLTNLLRALVDPWDEHALLGVLRSPIMALSDNSIVRLGWRKGLAQQFYGDAVLDDIVQQDRLATVRKWMHDFADHTSLPISELLQKIITTTHYEAILLSLPHGEQRCSNVRKMLDTARELTIAGKGSLSEIVKHLEDQSTPGVLEGDAPLMDEHRNAVTLMTIHGSKGLEFPVVILPDASTPPNSRSTDSHIASHARDGVVAKMPSTEKGDSPPPMYSLLNAVNKEEDLAEDARVLYVAMTRAKDYLVLSGTVLQKEKKKKKKSDDGGVTELVISEKSWLGKFDSVFGLVNSLEGGHVHEGISILSKPLGKRPAKDLQQQPATPPVVSSAQITPLEASVEAKEYVSTTAWLDEQFPVSGAVSEGFDLAQQTALVRGTMVHRYFEVWDFSKEAPDAQAFLARDFPAYAEDDAWLEYLAKIAQTLKASATYPVLRDSTSVEREIPFIVSIGKQWISGTIDALTESSIIIDYKTGVYRADSLARYETQLRLYAHALEQVTGKAAEKALLYFVDDGRTCNVDLSVPIPATPSSR